MAAGAQAAQHGWRSSYQTMGIFNAVLLFVFLIFYEETKYVPLLAGGTHATVEEQDTEDQDKGTGQLRENCQDKLDSSCTAKKPSFTERSCTHHELDLTIQQKPWMKRLVLSTPTPEPIWPHFYRPFCVLLFPAVSFAALQYAAGIACLTVTTNVLSLTFAEAPYFFSPAEIGYTGAGPLIGNILGALYGGYISDRSILYYARRNCGYYEPEMRLYILHLPAVLMAGGLILFGVTLSRVRQHHFQSTRGSLKHC